MKKYLFLFLFVFLVSLDLGSKYYFENNFISDFCISEQSSSLPENSDMKIWGISPQLFCSPAYDSGKIFDLYRDRAHLNLIGDFLSFKLSYNTGIAFSLPIQGILLKIITLLLIWGIIVHYIREEYKKKSLLLDSAYLLILSWAIPHAYERIFHGYVVDFIAVKYFAILNFADIFISVWVFLLILSYLSHEYARKLQS